MRRWHAIGILVVTLFAIAAFRPACAQDRLALVVGIDRYAQLAPLQKAVNDARAVGETLTRLGFRVELALDVDRRSFNRALSDFLNKITPGSIAYFHYSGHGISIDNETYLVPADMELPSANDREFVKREAVRLSELIDSLKNAKARARVMVIDACRDNPFAERGVRSIGTGRGLALLPAPEGTLILYSAADGQSALDTLGPNDTELTSVYTRTLLKQIAIPGQSMVTTAREVRREVEKLAKSIGHEQRPAYYDELSDDLRLSGPAANSNSPSEPQPTPKATLPLPMVTPPSVASSPAPRALVGALRNINMPGQDFSNFFLPNDDPALCQSACKADGRCAAWSYVQPGLQGTQARCWLKTGVPVQAANTCCVSGIERPPPPAAAPPAPPPAAAAAKRPPCGGPGQPACPK